MSHALNPIHDLSICRKWWVALIMTLLSFVVLAETADQLVLSPAYDPLQIEEIYASARDWRRPPAYESEWRPETQEQKSRIYFGYDSAYEEMKSREYNQGMFSGPDFAEPMPNSQFRIEFNY